METAVLCKNKEHRLGVLKFLMDLGYKWHGGEWSSPDQIESSYSFELYQVVLIEDEFYMQGAGKQTTHAKEAIPLMEFCNTAKILAGHGLRL